MSNSDSKYWQKENDDYGRFSSKTRTRAKNFAIAINTISIVIGLSFLLFPKYYKLQLITLFALPWVAFYLVYHGKGLWQTLSFEESDIPGFSSTLLFSFGIILLRAILDFTIVDYSNIWWTTLIGAPLLTALYLRISKREFDLKQQSKRENIVLIGCFWLVWSLYVFFSATMINCTFDKSPGHFMKSTVISKIEKRGRRGRRSYYVNVELPIQYHRTESVRINRNHWDDLEEGQSVDIEIKQGFLHAEWLIMYQP